MDGNMMASWPGFEAFHHISSQKVDNSADTDFSILRKSLFTPQTKLAEKLDCNRASLKKFYFANLQNGQYITQLSHYLLECLAVLRNGTAGNVKQMQYITT